LDTRQRKKEVYHFIIIVPHRDSLKPLEEYRTKLFTAGFFGAWSFPTAAPLASVSLPLDREELKELARNIRELTKKTDGKIHSTGNACVKFTMEGTEEEEQEYSSFYGSGLSLPIEESLFPLTAKAKILKTFSPPVLCAALIGSGERPPSEEGPALSFRAASLANLAIRPLESGAAGYSFEWKIGTPVWLPKYKGG
jgi:hypothetical protein